MISAKTQRVQIDKRPFRQRQSFCSLPPLFQFWDLLGVQRHCFRPQADLDQHIYYRSKCGKEWKVVPNATGKLIDGQ